MISIVLQRCHENESLGCPPAIFIGIQVQMIQIALINHEMASIHQRRLMSEATEQMEITILHLWKFTGAR